MKSIHRKDFIVVGVVEKAHGTKGELKFSFEQKIQLKEWVFIEINEKPVPFFIQSVSQNQTIIKLEGIDTPDEAERFVNSNILLPANQTKNRTRSVDVNVMGYLIIDETQGELGEVQEIEEMPQQILLHTTFRGKQLLIPAVDEFITEINDKKKVIYLSLPEGLIEL